LADLLTRVGKFKAWDGVGCLYDPILSGIGADGRPLYPDRTDDAAGTACGKDPKTGAGGAKYITPSYRLPAVLPAEAVIVASNGGSDYIYVPSHDAALVLSVVRFLQGREEIGPIFLSSRYSAPGTLSMAAAAVEASAGRRTPDIVVSYNYDENAVVAGMRGIEYESAQNYRGMHGSFSPIDVHNTLVAAGPDFRTHWADPLPTANVDLAPTVAWILGLKLPRADGRPLFEALVSGQAQASSYVVGSPKVTVSATATGLRVYLPTDTNGSRIDATRSSYRTVLSTRTVRLGGQEFTYYDWAKAIRE
jgi:hypothetical protein